MVDIYKSDFTIVNVWSYTAAMETAEISLALLIPGFMHAALTDSLFWMGLGIILPAGFAASYPAIYWAMKRGQQQGLRRSMINKQ